MQYNNVRTMRSMKANNTERHSHTGVMEHDTYQRREMEEL